MKQINDFCSIVYCFPTTDPAAFCKPSVRGGRLPTFHRKKRNIRRRGRAAGGEVRRLMNLNMHRVRRTPRVVPTLLTSGRVYDLAALYADINARFFGGRMRVPITWGRGVGRARRGGLTFGSYDPVLGLIRIHPVLDRPDVPRYFVESVVHHEMLHHHMGGVPDRAGRTVYHSRAFRARLLISEHK